MEENNREMIDLRTRTMQFALQIVRLYRDLPHGGECRVIGGQFLRSGTAPGAHYREAYRARSTPEFISKMETALQELDETDYWLEMLVQSRLIPESRVQPISAEARELIAIFTTCVRNAKKRLT